MSIYLNKDSKIIVQGMTGGMGAKHTTLMVESGANIVGGVNARKAGTTVELGGKELPVYGTVEEAMKETGANVSVAFVPPAFTNLVPSGDSLPSCAFGMAITRLRSEWDQSHTCRRTMPSAAPFLIS